MLYNFVGKQEVVDLSRCNSLVSGLLELVGCFNVVVALLNKRTVQASAHLQVRTVEWLDNQDYAVLFLL